MIVSGIGKLQPLKSSFVMVASHDPFIPIQPIIARMTKEENSKEVGAPNIFVIKAALVLPERCPNMPQKSAIKNNTKFPAMQAHNASQNGMEFPACIPTFMPDVESEKPIKTNNKIRVGLRLSAGIGEKEYS